MKRQAAANEVTELRDFFYANAVMGLFFYYIANIAEQRGKLVERNYGEGRNGKVIERL